MTFIGCRQVGVEQGTEQALAIVPAADGDLIAVATGEDGIGPLTSLVLLGAHRPAMAVDVEILPAHAAKVVECQGLPLHLDRPAGVGEPGGTGKAARRGRDAALEPVVLDVDEAGQGGDGQDPQHDDD